MRPVYNDELYHFGILGMKWGKRNGPSTSDMRKERTKINKQETGKALSKYKITDKRLKAIRYARLNGVDIFEGRGPSKEGAKYYKMNSEIDKLESKAIKEAGEKTASIMLDKYGKDNITRLNRSDNIHTALGMASVLAIPTGILASIAVSEFRK